MEALARTRFDIPRIDDAIDFAFSCTSRKAAISAPIGAGAGAPALALFGGACQGATGIAGPVVATWIHSYRLQSKTYVFAASLMFLAISGTHVFAVGGLGLYTEDRIIQGLWAIVPTVLFTQFGMWTTPYISTKWFNRLVISVIVIMWFKLIWQAVG